MDIQAYIESGTLEAYILGSLTPQEVKEVQVNIARYPELAAEVKAIENALLGLAQSEAIAPPLALQDKIWNAIESSTAGAGKIETKIPEPTKVIPVDADFRRRTGWALAAMLIFLIGSVLLNVSLYNQGKGDRAETDAMAAKMDAMQQHEQQFARLLAEYEKATTMMTDTAVQTIVMHTMVPGHPMAATMYWSKAKGDAYIALDALPQPPKGMQYQLWVIQGGKPVSMGTLPGAMAGTPSMAKVNMQVTTGEAFAISLEKAGGNLTPTTVYVLGKV